MFWFLFIISLGHLADEILTNSTHSEEYVEDFQSNTSNVSSSKLIDQLVDVIKSPLYCKSGFSEISHKAFDIIVSVTTNGKESSFVCILSIELPTW